jgi:DNA-binding MarR family transcriptional regulator
MAAVTSIMRAQQILLAELDAILRPYGLTFARYEALVLLSFSRAGALPLRVMGERLMVHPTSVTNTIDRLELQGMVVRRPNPDDGRGRLAEITEHGRDAVKAATRDLMKADFGLGGYSEQELGEMFGLLRGLRLEAGDFAELPRRYLTGSGAQDSPPSVVSQISCKPVSAGSATPWSVVVMPT